jgi:hypothetical protein
MLSYVKSRACTIYPGVGGADTSEYLARRLIT